MQSLYKTIVTITYQNQAELNRKSTNHNLFCPLKAIVKFHI